MNLHKFLCWLSLAFALSVLGWIGESWWESLSAGRTAEAWAKSAVLISLLALAGVAAIVVSGSTEVVISGDFGELFGDDDDDEGEDDDPGPTTRPLGNGHIHKIA